MVPASFKQSPFMVQLLLVLTRTQFSLACSAFCFLVYPVLQVEQFPVVAEALDCLTIPSGFFGPFNYLFNYLSVG
jgi:hypothetical protein